MLRRRRRRCGGDAGEGAERGDGSVGSGGDAAQGGEEDGRPPKAWPISDETVSAVASARAARTARSTTARVAGERIEARVAPSGYATSAAMPRLAMTWAALSGRGAVRRGHCGVCGLAGAGR